MATNKNKKRLVLTLYRSLMRFSSQLPPDVPLDEFIEPMQGKIMDNVKVFQSVLRESFRSEVKTPQELTDRIQQGLDGWKQLEEILPDIMAYGRQWGKSIRRMQKQKDQNDITGTESDGKDSSYVEREWIQQRLEAVNWLPKVEECTSCSLDVDPDNIFPLFPLRGALFYTDALAATSSSTDNNHKDDNGLLPLPLFSPQQEIPVPGMEVSLLIFEPRYRQLYRDLIAKSSPGNQKLVVPFCHPLVPGRFAQYGLVYHLVDLEEVSDETNGKILYLAEHEVTQPILMEQILNPQVWATKESYLQVHGKLVQDNESGDSRRVYQPLRDVLEEWKRDTSHPLATKSLEVLDGEGLWAFVHTWNLHYQQELLHLQIGVITQVKRHAQLNKIVTTTMNSGGSVEFTGFLPDVVARAQQPHRRRLIQLMLDTSLLVPSLLSMDGEAKCNYLHDMVRLEWKYLKTNSFE